MEGIPKEARMKIQIAVSALLALGLAACAGQETQQVAKADCKIAPVTTRSAVNKPGPVTDLDRRWAQAQLANSDYRREQLTRNALNNNVEDALRDCP
jgi:hypothetical protein